MTDSIDTSDREAEEPRGTIRLPVREMRAEPVPKAALAAAEQAESGRFGSAVPCRCFDGVSRKLCINKHICSRAEAYSNPASGFGPKLLPQVDGFAAAPEAPAQAEQTKCRFCGGTGQVEQYTSAAAPRVKAKCPMCAGDGVCRTPKGCTQHGCHGGCLPSPEAPAQAAAEPVAELTADELVVGGRYNWKGQPERLAYIGTMRYPGDNRTWYQFEKVDEPGEVWCEVLSSELHMLEPTTTPAQASDAEDAARYRWLREQPPEPDDGRIDVCLWLDHAGQSLRGEQLDAAIDAARKGEQP